MRVPAPYEISGGALPAITVHALKENKRPVGFAPWPDEPAKKPRPKRKPTAPKDGA